MNTLSSTYCTIKKKFIINTFEILEYTLHLKLKKKVNAPRSCL